MRIPRSWFKLLRKELQCEWMRRPGIRIITWIDFNAPFHGTWTEIAGKERVEYPARRRRELLLRYAAMDTDPEAIPATPSEAVAPVMPEPLPEAPQPELNCPNWPLTEEEARKRQEALGETRRSVDLGNGIRLDLVLIPPGEFVMGQTDGLPDETPASVIAIDKPFWMGACEVTNAQFTQFDSSHDSGVESRFSMQFGVRGFYVSGPEQPVVRVSEQGDGILRMAFRKHRGTLHPAHRSAMGICVPCRNGHPVFLWWSRSGLVALCQPGRRQTARIRLPHLQEGTGTVVRGQQI